MDPSPFLESFEIQKALNRVCRFPAFRLLTRLDPGNGLCSDPPLFLVFLKIFTKKKDVVLNLNILIRYFGR